MFSEKLTRPSRQWLVLTLMVGLALAVALSMAFAGDADAKKKKHKHNTPAVPVCQSSGATTEQHSNGNCQGA